MYNLNVTEVRDSDFKNDFPGIFDFTVGILNPRLIRIKFTGIWGHRGGHILDTISVVHTIIVAILFLIGGINLNISLKAYFLFLKTYQSFGILLVLRVF